MSIEVKRQSLPERCEICHQADSFNAELNYCGRCNKLEQKPDVAKMSKFKEVGLTVGVLLIFIAAFVGLILWSGGLVDTENTPLLVTKTTTIQNITQAELLSVDIAGEHGYRIEVFWQDRDSGEIYDREIWFTPDQIRYFASGGVPSIEVVENEKHVESVSLYLPKWQAESYVSWTALNVPHGHAQYIVLRASELRSLKKMFFDYAYIDHSGIRHYDLIIETDYALPDQLFVSQKFRLPLYAINRYAHEISSDQSWAVLRQYKDRIVAVDLHLSRADAMWLKDWFDSCNGGFCDEVDVLNRSQALTQ